MNDQSDVDLKLRLWKTRDQEIGAQASAARLASEVVDAETRRDDPLREVLSRKSQGFRRRFPALLSTAPKGQALTGRRISVITPVYNPEPRVLEECIASVLRQSVASWELCLVNDGSTRDGVSEVLAQAAARDPRVRVLHRQENGGIVAASNDALAMATGEFIALLDHDDALEPDALQRVLAAIDSDDTIDYLYTDEDHLNVEGHPFGPFLKPDWSPERFRSQMYTCHLSVIRRALVEEIGGFRPGFDGAQDYDLILRVTEKCRTIHHVPEVLYHWRMGQDSVVGNTDAKPYAFEAGRRAVQEHCDRVGIDAEVVHGRVPGVYRVRRRLRFVPTVSVIISTDGNSCGGRSGECTPALHSLRGLVERSTYPNLEFVVVYDEGAPETSLTNLRELCGERLRLVESSRSRSFSEKLNLGAAHASGELLLLLHDDVDIIEADSVEVMAALALESEVGLVGARLLLLDGRLQHAGHVYADGDPRTIFYRRGGEELGPANLLATQRECSGISAACAMMRATVFDEIGGLSTPLHSQLSEVDLSLKVTSLGYRVVWTPYASLYHFESSPQDTIILVENVAALFSRWGHVIVRDPYMNPSLDQTRDDSVVTGSMRLSWKDRVKPGRPPGSHLARARTVAR